jgi:hypothetical protein
MSLVKIVPNGTKLRVVGATLIEKAIVVSRVDACDYCSSRSIAVEVDCPFGSDADQFPVMLDAHRRSRDMKAL